MVEHLYVHIPFCPKICPYCSFYKETTDRNKTLAFLDALLADAALRAKNLRPRTIFFGGGTPTALSTPQLQYLLEGFRERLDLGELVEWTMEMNPATVSLEKAEMLQSLGVNRVSMGVQAWQPDLLQTLGRVHSAEQAERSFRILREAGYSNLNLDLIFGIPGQTAAQWEESLRKTAELGPEHISAYCLTYEEDTRYFESLQAGLFAVDEEKDAGMFSMTESRLEEFGYEAYEISNFARAGNRCLHNLAYWEGRDYLGLGPSAFSTVGSQRWRNVADTARYIESMKNGMPEQDFSEEVPGAVRRSEQRAFGLRTSDGIPLAGLPEAELGRLVGAGLMKREGDRCRLTSRGRLLADEIATELLG